ncbi:MAG: 2-amino-4-hydroxy-6-hydroxymethyldihydropteridine diphosphokinase [Hyphomicrobiales bacterium]
MTSADKIWQPVGFSLGSNQGDRIAVLNEALDALHASDGLRLTVASSFYETAPWGVEDQASFLNLCVIGETNLSPRALMTATQAIENKMGRVKTIRWGPRLIDIDILYCGDHELSTDDLTVPHKHMLDRVFVLMPLAEIAPDVVIRGTRVEDGLNQLQVDADECALTSDEKWTPNSSGGISS